MGGRGCGMGGRGCGMGTGMGAPGSQRHPYVLWQTGLGFGPGITMGG